MEPACDSAAPSSESLREARRFVEGNGTLARALGVDGPGELTVLPLAQGEHNANFVLEARDGRRFVLRVNYASQLGLDDQIGYEFAALRALASSGRTPEPLYVDGTGSRIGRGALVESFVEGAWIDLEDSRQVRERPGPSPTCTAWRHPPIVRFFGREPLRSQLESCRRLFDGYQASDLAEGRVMREVDELFVRAQRAVDAAPVPSPCECSHILNTEAVPSHFLIDGTGRASIVDWEKPVLGEVSRISPTSSRRPPPFGTAMSFSALLSGRSSLQYGRRWAAASPGVTSTPAFRPIAWSTPWWASPGAATLGWSTTIRRAPCATRSLELLPIYFSEEFLDLIRRDCFDAL